MKIITIIILLFLCINCMTVSAQLEEEPNKEYLASIQETVKEWITSFRNKEMENEDIRREVKEIIREAVSTYEMIDSLIDDADINTNYLQRKSAIIIMEEIWKSTQEIAVRETKKVLNRKKGEFFSF